MGDKKPAMTADELDDILGTEEVPGFPGFKWHSKVGQATPDEKRYREGYSLAVQQLYFAIRQGDGFSRGYQHAREAIVNAHRRRGLLDSSDLEEWVRDTGARWLSDLPQDKKVLPPPIRLEGER